MTDDVASIVKHADEQTLRRHIRRPSNAIFAIVPATVIDQAVATALLMTSAPTARENPRVSLVCSSFFGSNEIFIRQNYTLIAYFMQAASQGHFTAGGRLERMEATLPPVFRPKMVPRS